jgi:hypothetical protein
MAGRSALEIASPRMTLKAGAGFHPVVVFRPQLSSLESVREMIRLAGGSTSRLAIQGVELRLELPSDPSYGWSLLAMYTGQSLELADCVLTVQNVDERHTQVAMIDVRARRPAETMTMTQPQPSMASPTRLSLDRCIARGAASVIGMNEETPLDVRWNQGLIVTPWYFVETARPAIRRFDVDGQVGTSPPSAARPLSGRAAAGRMSTGVDVDARPHSHDR